MSITNDNFPFQTECNRKNPPGRKIYENSDGLSVFEVDGTCSEVNKSIEPIRRNVFSRSALLSMSLSFGQTVPRKKNDLFRRQSIFVLRSRRS